MADPESGAGDQGARRGPQGTQIFSQNELDRLIAESVTEVPAGASVSLRGASESVAGRVIPLDRPTLVIGRAPHCDLVIDEASVSSEHARMTQDGGNWRIANLLSTNGTFVNGKRATSAVLRHGDHIRVGRIDFVFEVPGGGAAPEPARPRRTLWWVLAVLVVAGAALAWMLAG